MGNFDRMNSIFIASPVYGGLVTTGYLVSVLDTQAQLIKHNIPYELQIIIDSMVQKARDILTAKFLRTKNSHILWLDADVDWKAKDVLRLLSHDKDIVCGIYPKKRFPIEYPIVWTEDDKDVDEDGLIEIVGAGAGFLLIKREVMEKMVEAYPEKKYIAPDAIQEKDQYLDLEVYGLWDTYIENEVFYGEDISFLKRWRAIGGKVFLDTKVYLKHIGSYAYEEPE
tara:strand:+ start:21 stop:695 length:675 start_codon:yes stop_codon:yes gene_type:complete